jgi:hypothetical protein
VGVGRHVGDNGVFATALFLTPMRALAVTELETQAAAERLLNLAA